MAVPYPRLSELEPLADLADAKDLPILAAAVRECCPWLVTFNLCRFQPGHFDVTVLRPGDFVLPVRDVFAWMTQEPEE